MIPLCPRLPLFDAAAPPRYPSGVMADKDISYHRTLIVIPTYDEVENLPALLADLRERESQF